MANVKERGIENSIEGASFVVVRIHPARTGGSFTTDVPFVKIIPVTDEGILVKDEAPVVDSRVTLFLQLPE
jgi:hypothetical protein